MDWISCPNCEWQFAPPPDASGKTRHVSVLQGNGPARSGDGPTRVAPRRPPVRVGATGFPIARTIRDAPRDGCARGDALEGPNPSARSPELPAGDSAKPSSPAATPAQRPATQAVGDVNQSPAPSSPAAPPARRPAAVAAPGGVPSATPTQRPTVPTSATTSVAVTPSRVVPVAPASRPAIPQASPSWVDRARPVLALFKGMPRRLALPWVVGGGILAVLVLMAIYFTREPRPDRVEKSDDPSIAADPGEPKKPDDPRIATDPGKSRLPVAAQPPEAEEPDPTIGWRDKPLPPASQDPDAPILLVQLHSLDRLFDAVKAVGEEFGPSKPID